MWLLAYWWQALILIALYSFLFLIYKEVIQEHQSEPAALFMVVKGSVECDECRLTEGKILLLYQNEHLILHNKKIFVEDGEVLLEQSGDIKKIKPGEVFDFAGVFLQLMRWDNARQFINKYRISTKSQ